MKKATQKKEPTVEMISYSIRMTIPTGAYANIIPEIIVKAGTVEEAEAYVIPHMNKLWKEYFMCSERLNQPAKLAEKAPEAPKMPPVVENPAPVVADEAVPAPASAVALNKATQAIASCMSKEALALIEAQVEKSVKLNDENKVALRVLLTEKMKDLIDPIA